LGWGRRTSNKKEDEYKQPRFHIIFLG